MNFSGDYNHRIGNQSRNFVNNTNNRPLVSYSSDDFALASFLAGGSFGGGGGLPYMLPQHLYHSYPPSVSVFRPLQDHRRLHQQPPLLPLPISTPPNHHRLSSPPVNKSVKNRSRDKSLTPKKSKNQKDSKKHRGNLLPQTSTEAASLEKSSAINRMGPDPKDLPKDFVSRVLSPPINDFSDIISGSVVFTTSPPPSSLPLPTFSLRPKLSCNTAGAGVDAGATDNLRQLLRLR